VATINVAPGGNLTTAYNSAVNGDTIQLAAGSYGAWVTPIGTKSVTVNGVGPTTTFTLITCRLANAALKNFRCRCISDPSQFDGDPAAQTNNWRATLLEDVLIDGENRTVPISGTGYTTGAVAPEYAVLNHNSSLSSGNTFRRVEVRNAVNAKGHQHSGSGHTFESVYTHDITVNNTGRLTEPIDRSVHNEGMYVLASPGLTLRGCKFFNCPTMNVFFTSSVDAIDPRTKNVTLENCVFGHCRDASNNWHGGPCVRIGNTESYSIPAQLNPDGSYGPLDNFKIRYCLFEHGLVLGAITSDPADRPVINGSEIRGCIGGWDNLASKGMVYRYNVGTKIHATDLAVSPSESTPTTPIPVGWVNPAAGDFHLTAASVAVGRGDPTNFPATDYDGAVRS
jgi:hypothetical protein